MATSFSHKNQTISESIAASLQHDILTGRYRVGDRLPSERELATRFSASRGAVREGLKALEHLHLASIQPGGARVLPIEECTLDILGPLLDLQTAPDAKRVDETMQLMGLMLDAAVRDALEKATDEELEVAKDLVAEVLSVEATDLEQHQAMHQLFIWFVDHGDNLVMRLTMNGLRLTFLERFQRLGMERSQDSTMRERLAAKLQSALESRDADSAVTTMREMNQFARAHMRDLLDAASNEQQAESA